MATVSFLYPAGPDLDLDYVKDVHMPSIVTAWAMLGLKSWEVIEYTARGAEYQAEILLRWDNIKAWNKCPKNDIMDDISRFTKAKPVIVAGKTYASFVI